ncbi:hypothetical protein DPM19_12055 [Actinomadura craniellae]|uniref:Uncharacterized protein n=1 Tax=Actinomadura craniellae TaxID=2231787 RepID=A0A365H8Z6_9ACTN|nr:hypothetical protein DPM19_12055 [Actinomadura craniellae]
MTAAVRYFPLLGRPRPVCRALPTRVQEITDLAHAAHTARQQGADAVHDAAHALNKAALLVSDCGLIDDARRLCRQHIDLYRAAGSRLTVSQARHMLEPVVNLARLHIRDDAPRTALRVLEATHHAATAGTDLTVDDRVLPLAHLTGTRRERNKLREWVWLQLLTDGIRALARAGDWNDAVALAEAHRGIGAHLMEGRQAAILAARLDGKSDEARRLLHAGTLTQPWEHQVASCLEVMCGGSDRPHCHRAATEMIHRFRHGEPVTGYAVFRARLGLAVAALAHPHVPAAVPSLLAQAAAEAIAAEDGYAAREVLHHRTPDADLSAGQRHALHGLVTAGGLGVGPLPPPLQDAFTDATGAAVKALAASLQENST